MFWKVSSVGAHLWICAPLTVLGEVVEREIVEREVAETQWRSGRNKFRPLVRDYGYASLPM